MKKYLLLSCLFCLFVSACTITNDPIDEPQEESGKLELTSGMSENIVLDPEGSFTNLRFNSPVDWHIELSENASWVEVSPLEGNAGKGRIKVKAEVNATEDTRTAEFRVCAGDEYLVLNVKQEPYVFQFELPQTQLQIGAEGGLLTIPFTTNQDYEVVCDDEWVVLPVTTDKRSEFLLCAVEPNHTRAARTSEIIVSCELAEVTVTVTQAAAEGLLSQWADKSFAQRSLAMRFTADWCGYCPLMATAFDSAKEQMPDAFEIVGLHGSNSTYEFSGTNQLAKRFNISGYPTGVVDSRASIPNYSSTATTATIAVQVAQETQKSYPSVAGIAVDSYISGTDLTVFVPIYFHQPDSYRVTVLLLEDGIVGYQNGGGNSYTHNDVARYAFTSMSGESVKIESANTVWTQVYTTKINSAWNPDNLKVLVYVERPYGDQSKVQKVANADYGNYGDTYIDNCRAVMVGKKAALELR